MDSGYFLSGWMNIIKIMFGIFAPTIPLCVFIFVLYVLLRILRILLGIIILMLFGLIVGFLYILNNLLLNYFPFVFMKTINNISLKNVMISDFFNKKIDFLDDRRSFFDNKCYILDAVTRKSFHSSRMPGLWRFLFDNLDDCVSLENALLYLHLCSIGQTHIYPPVLDGCQLVFDFKEN